MIDFVLPSLGADMDQAMLVGWLVKPGDEIEYGQVIAEVETDKGVIEVECWHDGVAEELLVQPGPERLPVGTPLAKIRLRDEVARRETEATPPTATPTEHRPPEDPKTPTPPIRHLAHTLGVDLNDVAGTGPNGSITREDLERAAATPRSESPGAVAPAAQGRAKASPRARQLARRLGIDLESVTPKRTDGLVTYSDVEAVSAQVGQPEDKTAAMRRAITRSMTRSNREIPHYYLATRIDLQHALDWLETQNDAHSITQHILPAVLLLKATALAVRETPEINGHWGDDHFVATESVHLGVAISLRDGGLVAPAIHDADSLDLGDLMECLRDLVTRARAWKLRSSEISDPTITVTNLGDRGVETAFPLIIPPQVAMVGFGKILDDVVAVDGTPTVHPVVHVTLAADHRVTDGHTGGLFLTALDRLLQKPEQL